MGVEIKIFFAAAGVVCLWMTLLAQDASQKQESRTPFMVSLTDLKWVELPERKGMQFAILSGDPKTGPYTQMRKVPAGTDNGLHSHSSEIKNVIISGVWYTGPLGVLTIIRDQLRRRPIRSELCAYFLQARGERFNLLLLFGDCRSLLLHFLMCF
jgi:hypothetical protein